MTDPIHYLKLSLTNVRAFGGRQTLDLSKDGVPSRWCVIIGENGVGKTTLLQALAALRPVPSFGTDEPAQSTGEEAAPPSWAEPGMADYENARIIGLVRKGEEVEAALEADLASESGGSFSIGYRIQTADGKLVSAEPIRAQRHLASNGPLVIAYSAFRHAGHKNMADFADVEATESLFNERIALFDPDEVAERLDYQSLDARRNDDKDAALRLDRILDKLTTVLIALVPDLTRETVHIRGTEGIRVETRSGLVPLADLSLGAQTTIAWIADLAWRLHMRFPNSPDPFCESAIVLIDEVELHLHPVWQRSLRAQLLQHFPHIQFIVTTHSPVAAQESVAQGDPISVVSWQGAHSVIAPDPFPVSAVKLDEVVTGLFELETSLATRFEALLRERRSLLQRRDLASSEKYRLLSLNRVAHALQGGAHITEAELESLMAGDVQDGVGATL